MKDNNASFLQTFKKQFMQMSVPKRIFSSVAAILIVATLCAGVIWALGGGNNAFVYNPETTLETQTPVTTPNITPNVTTDATQAPEATEEAKETEQPTQVQSNNIAMVTGESNIAANAATNGGTNVESYEQKNKTQMQQYTKEEVPVEEQKIVATSAAVCDIMDRLGIDLIGVPATTVSTIAARYNDVTRVGSPMEPDMEIIKKINPSDVIGPDTLQADLQMKYDNIGVKSTFVNLRSVQGLYDSVKAIGYHYGKQAEADAIIAEYKEFMSFYSSGHEGEPSPKVLVLMGLPGSYLVATQNSYAGSLVELAGGENVFHHDSKDFITVNTEAILAADPDVIIRTAHGLPEEAIAMFNREFSTNDIWKHFRAVKEGRVYDVDYMLFGMSATFDYPQALADLEPMLYGG